MKSEEKEKYIKKLKEIISKINVDELISLPDKSVNDQGIFKAKAIFTNFDHKIGDDFDKLVKEFLEVARAKKRINHINNLANDIKNFIAQKIEEMDVYVIESDDKIFTGILKRLYEIKESILQGLAKPEEKLQILEESKERAKLFKDELYRRKAEKLSKETIWSNQTHDGFVSSNGGAQLQLWINIFEDYLGQRKIKRKIKNENFWIQSNIEGKDEHLFIGERNNSKEKAHLIIDSETGEIRIDRIDQSPHEILNKIENVIVELRDGKKVRATKSSMEFLDGEDKEEKSSILVYTSNKEDYFSLEIYNCGGEDINNIVLKVFWKQPEGDQERILTKFVGENERMLFAHPHELNILRSGEKKFAVHIPSISTDKKIKVKISYTKVRSKESFNEEFEFETPNQYNV